MYSSVTSPPQCRSQAVVCVSTPRMYPQKGKLYNGIEYSGNFQGFQILRHESGSNFYSKQQDQAFGSFSASKLCFFFIKN